jgi:hypothetical protein
VADSRNKANSVWLATGQQAGHFGFPLRQFVRNEEPKAVQRHCLYYFVATYFGFVKSHFQSMLKIHEILHKPFSVNAENT